MAAPIYSGGPQYRHGGYHRHYWGHAPGPTGNGGHGSLGSWFDDVTPLYAGPGQPTPGTIGNPPVYLPAPSTGNAGPAPTTPQPIAAVIVSPQG